MWEMSFAINALKDSFLSTFILWYLREMQLQLRLTVFVIFICVVHTSQIERIQVNLCQKLLFLHQLTHNMTTDFSLNYKFNTWKFLAQNMGRTCCVQKLFLKFRTISVHSMFYPKFCKKKSFWQRFTCMYYIDFMV